MLRSLAGREEATSEDRIKILDGAKVVFFTGGDQLKITSQLGDSAVCQTVEKIYQEGGTVAGTSAGASVMSETKLHVLSEGNRFNLAERRPEVPPKPEEVAEARGARMD